MFVFLVISPMYQENVMHQRRIVLPPKLMIIVRCVWLDLLKTNREIVSLAKINIARHVHKIYALSVLQDSKLLMENVFIVL